jgi:Asp-tRNA(Asn)/Glu-tRNA(Gln) amidotransferase C subunit
MVTEEVVTSLAAAAALELLPERAPVVTAILASVLDAVTAFEAVELDEVEPELVFGGAWN